MKTELQNNNKRRLCLGCSPRQRLGPPILLWFRTDEQPDRVSITVQCVLNILKRLLCTFSYLPTLNISKPIQGTLRVDAL